MTSKRSRRVRSRSSGAGSGAVPDYDERKLRIEALESAIEAERARLFRAEAVAGCLRVTLNEVWLPGAGEPDLSYVANVIENLIGGALEGLDRAITNLGRIDATGSGTSAVKS